MAANAWWCGGESVTAECMQTVQSCLRDKTVVGAGRGVDGAIGGCRGQSVAAPVPKVTDGAWQWHHGLG